MFGLIRLNRYSLYLFAVHALLRTRDVMYVTFQSHSRDTTERTYRPPHHGACPLIGQAYSLQTRWLDDPASLNDDS